MIKYLGSKRRLVAELGALLDAAGASTALDLFTGTTRVAQEFCRRGAFVTAVDTASYSEVFAQCYVETPADSIDPDQVAEAITRLSALPGRRGYVTQVFAEKARYFHPDNAVRIDAIRQGIDDLFPDGPLRPLLLTALLEAADAVDSTVGLQMAFLKHWAPRALRPLRLRAPVLTPGTGLALRRDARLAVTEVAPVGLAYLDPPYNQHRYFANYHVWETLVRWDAPAHYGIACKRTDAREAAGSSDFNSRRRMPGALAEVIAAVRAEVVVVSFSAEGFVSIEAVQEMLEVRGNPVAVFGYGTRRYIGSAIGIYSPSGVKVGTQGHDHTVEYLLVSAPESRLAALQAAAEPQPGDAVTAR